MDFYGITMKGPFHIEPIATLSAWQASDEGRIVYAEDVNILYYGTDIKWSVMGGGNGASKDVTQPAHGFVVGAPLYLNSATYTKAQADSSIKAEVIGMVSAVVGAGVFTLTNCGFITGIDVANIVDDGSNLVPGSVYYLDEVTAGKISLNPPGLLTSVNKPLLIADSTTSGFFFNFRGVENTDPSVAYNVPFTSADLAAGILTANHNLGSKYVVPIIYDNTGKVIEPDEFIAVTLNQMTIDLSSYGAITGTWYISILGAGAIITYPVSAANGGTGKSNIGDLTVNENSVISGTDILNYLKVQSAKLSCTNLSTYSLVYTVFAAYVGGVLSPNGDIHFVPYRATVGQKISSSGVVSTYSLVYTVLDAYSGGVLSPNGDIHFIPLSAKVGQKISSSGVVSTYSLVYTVSAAYYGGVLSPNGDIHFVPLNATVAQKISSSGVVSTYSLVYTVSSAYSGGVLSPNGDIHFIPVSATVGQKISSSGVVSTYSLVYTVSSAYAGGVLSPNGDIHFIPCYATVGQKINSSGVVSTYSLVYTVTNAHRSGVLSPNGDIHFIPTSATVGQKISNLGVVSTYSLVYTVSSGYVGGVLSPNGDIYFIPYAATTGQKISTQPAIPFDLGTCLSPWFNKF